MQLLTTLAVLAWGAPLLAQTAPDSAACRAALSAPTRDTDVVRVTVMISTFDREHPLPTAYSALLHDAFRQVYRPPKPLELSVYDVLRDWPAAMKLDPMRATLTARGVYRAFLRADGQIVHARVVGGMRSSTFDASVLAALDSMNAQEGVAVFSDDGHPAVTDSVDLRIAVGATAFRAPGMSAAPETPGMVPLFEYRTPVRHATQRPSQLPGNRAPRYPADLRSQRVEGKVVARFILMPSGAVDLSSVEFVDATRGQFAAAVATALPDMRFYPMAVEGCAVPSYVFMPFEFNLIGW